MIQNPSVDPALETRVQDWARARMSAERFHHSRQVVETVTHLAGRYNIPAVASLRLAGWIHDAAKELPNEEILALAAALNYDLRPVERLCPPLVHGAVAARLAQRELALDDPVMISATTYHTTGHPAMSQADKAFYLADLVEPSRTFAWIDQVRLLADRDLDTALLYALTYQLRRLLKRGAIIDPWSIELHNQLLAAGVPLVPRNGS